jgi:hypothetical protein
MWEFCVWIILQPCYRNMLNKDWLLKRKILFIDFQLQNVIYFEKVAEKGNWEQTVADLILNR